MAKLLDKIRNSLFPSRNNLEEEMKNTMPTEELEFYRLRHDMDLLLKSVSITLKNITDTFITTHNAKQVYETLKALDSDGFILYDTCKTILKCDVRKAFTSDESMGRFEMANGFGMMHFAEIYCFGNYDFDRVGCYEILGQYEIDYNTPKYLAYQRELWLKAVENVLYRFEIEKYEDIPEILKSLLDLKSKVTRESSTFYGE